MIWHTMLYYVSTIIYFAQFSLAQWSACKNLHDKTRVIQHCGRTSGPDPPAPNPYLLKNPLHFSRMCNELGRTIGYQIARRQRVGTGERGSITEPRCFITNAPPIALPYTLQSICCIICCRESLIVQTGPIGCMVGVASRCCILCMRSTTRLSKLQTPFLRSPSTVRAIVHPL